MIKTRTLVQNIKLFFVQWNRLAGMASRGRNRTQHIERMHKRLEIICGIGSQQIQNGLGLRAGADEIALSCANFSSDPHLQ